MQGRMNELTERVIFFLECGTLILRLPTLYFNFSLLQGFQLPTCSETLDRNKADVSSGCVNKIAL
jgi:hypothetical protein